MRNFWPSGDLPEASPESTRIGGAEAVIAGADLLTISPELLDQLEQTEGAVERALDPEQAKASKEVPLRVDEKTFRWMHNEDAMATEKLAEGIRKFNADARHLQDYALTQVAAKSA